MRVGRFAPSPTGAMHLGNARTALLAWLHSRALGGRHLLRFEDLDAGRVRAWAYDVTRRDLEWLGLGWDQEFTQSERTALYGAAAARLDAYPCTCTRREVLEAVGAPHGAEVVYPGTCREPSARVPGRPAALRWRVPAGEVCARDDLSGNVLCQDLARDVGDVVLARNDGAFAYHLAVVVDDALMGVTDVVRGVDLWPATPRQVALQRALGYGTPRYWHVPLMTDYAGARLAKRGGAPPVMALREAGERPGRVLSALAQSLGWAVPEEVTAGELLPLWRAWATGREGGVD
ncbi:tRNA glutamyl-Q(34) synthetase GluQRS [Deinococcus maricopensis]|uniref:Glutamyl-Q tRNA(Asp) synthetase n=1 Tax=Deinococcus maricopensis (strain DSM 21211 / LMG 22137 / NRRL B-23946 / LB-34) TaxID=709986 RepID=E8U8W0_DEIML|nr:tRNA glutamyl-Q(34) synthetase GluQRS [Deinococcus maricopensis]ADV67499.1 Glutamyl-Q tRNA(Asp) synthetase [Deinococcus maricopensis DSM 21211]